MAWNANGPAGDRAAKAKAAPSSHDRRDYTELLNRLDGLRQTGPDTFRADCPLGHRSRGTLAIKNAGDRLLIVDHAGHSAAEIVAAVGLELADLFDRPEHREQLPHRDRLRVNPRDVLAAIRFDLIRLAMLLSNVATTGARITPETHAVISSIAGNLVRAAEVAR